MITDTVIFFKFHIENITVWALSFPDFIIILIHAGYRTGTAGHTFAQIEIDRVFFHCCTFLLIPQRVELYAGKPE